MNKLTKAYAKGSKDAQEKFAARYVLPPRTPQVNPVNPVGARPFEPPAAALVAAATPAGKSTAMDAVKNHLDKHQSLYTNLGLMAASVPLMDMLSSDSPQKPQEPQYG